MYIPLEERIAGSTRWFERRNERPLDWLHARLVLSAPALTRKAFSTCPPAPSAPATFTPSNFSTTVTTCTVCTRRRVATRSGRRRRLSGCRGLRRRLAAVSSPISARSSSRSTPPHGFADHPSIPVFSSSNPWVEKLLECIPALEKRSAGRYPVGATLLRGISDLLSALYGGGNFVLKMHDDPEEIQAMVDGLTELWIAFGRCVMDRLPLFHGGTGCYMYGQWVPGKTIWLQEDAVALLSPALFNRHIYPADVKIAEAFEHVAIHLHPTRYIASQLLSESPISVVELHLDFDGPRAEKLAPHHRTLLKSKPLLVWGDVQASDLEFMLAELPSEGLAINLIVGSVEEAHRIWDHAMELWQRRVTAGLAPIPGLVSPSLFALPPFSQRAR